jgi:hypothetical protein
MRKRPVRSRGPGRGYTGLADLQLADQEVQDLAVDGLLDLQAHRRAEAAPHQFLLQRLEEVLGVVLLDLQVLVAGDAEGVALQDLHAREEFLQVGGDDVLDGDEAARGGLQEAGEQRGDLDAGEVAVPGDRVAHDDREVQGEARDVREGVRGVDGERGEDREDLVAEEGEQAGLLLLRQLAPADQVDALFGEGGRHVLLEAGGVPGHQLARARPDHLQHLAGLEAGGGAGGDTGGDAALQAGDADHEELVEVAGEDREEVGALEDGSGRVLGEFEDALVEREPAAFAVEEAALREPDAVRLEPLGLLRLLVPVEVGVDVGFQVGDRRGHGVRAVRGDGTHGGLRVLRVRRGLGLLRGLRVLRVLLELCLGLRLPHEPILPRSAQDRRVGRRVMLCSWWLWHGRLHSVRVARQSESMVTRT